MLADRYDKEQAELTEKIEQYEREGRAEHDQLDKIQDLLMKSASTLVSPN